jgi:sugar/nucleoside kinase (ribokinase family)
VSEGTRTPDLLGAIHQLCFAGTARQVDATGAGDAFAAALMAALLAEHGIRAAMERGAAQGAAAVEALQSIPPDWAEILDRA